MDAEGQVGPVVYTDGSVQPLRLGKLGDGIMSGLHGRYYEQNYRGNIYSFANQAAVTCGAGLSTTMATISLSNNLGSGRNISLLQAAWTFSTSPAAAATVYLVGGYSATTNVTHGTPGIVQSGIFGGGSPGVGKADSASTLPLAPVALLPIISAPGATGLGPYSGVVDLNGSFILPPGGFVAIQANAAAVGFGMFIWEEIPI